MNEWWQKKLSRLNHYHESKQIKLVAIPATLREANDYIQQHHRHHGPVQGHLFSIGCATEDKLVGIVVVGRPVARMLQDGVTCEVTRLCSTGERNVCSFLYSRAARAAREIGYKRLFTYTLESEPGASLRATGFVEKGLSGGGSWSRPSRGREDKHPLDVKKVWSLAL